METGTGEHSIPEPTAVGYEFLGWYQKGEDDELTGDPLAMDTRISTNVEFYAKWEPRTYLVAFNKGAGESVSRAKAADKNEPAEPTTDPIYAIVEYDAPLSAMRYAEWTQEGYVAETGAAGALPYGWKLGEVFSGFTAQFTWKRQRDHEGDGFQRRYVRQR